jgi:hypothetical protein
MKKQKQLKYSFQIESMDDERIKALSRGVKIAEKLRIALRKILDEAGV